MNTIRLLAALLLAIPLAGCAPDDAAPVSLTWYTVDLECDTDMASTYWTLPEPAPLIAQAREETADYTGYVAVGTSGTDGRIRIGCNTDITVTYAMVID
jgi:hypothetical protein